MKAHYLVEITQHQKIIVEVYADCEQAAIELTHNHHGKVQSLLPPELLIEESKVIRCQSNVE